MYGLRPDSTAGPGDDVTGEIHYDTADARRTVTFWLYVTGGFLTAALGTGLVFHHFSNMTQNGIARSNAALMFVGYGFVSAAAHFVTGFLADRIPPSYRPVLLLVSTRPALLAMVAPFLPLRREGHIL